MAIIGEIIKRAINVNGLITKDPAAADAQTAVLMMMLEKAKNTAFGRTYHFDEILSDADPVRSFQERVPIYDYDKLYAEWWHYLEEGHENITWPGGQRYFAMSSGTTSNSKAIPVTDDMLDAIKKSGIQQVMSLKNFDLPADFFEKDIMMLGSSTELKDHKGFLAGEISGISAANLPLWFRKFYKPGKKIAASKDWDERVARIVRSAKKWDVGSMSGMPSWSELMLREIIRYNKVDTIHDIWPNLQVYTTGGVAFGPYRKSFDKLFARPVTYIDTYLASEGYLATQKRPDAAGMALIVDNGIFFEFVPFVESNMDDAGSVRQDATVLTLEQIEEGVEYVLLISTVAGAWRYMIGDTVVFTDKERSEIMISGRTKHFLNVVGEQLSVHQMNNAIQSLQAKFDLDIKEFTVSTVLEDNKRINKWYLGADKVKEATDVSTYLDEELQRTNKNYKVARDQALDAVEVKVIPVENFHQWSEQHKKLGGQAKIPRVMDEEAFVAFEQYLHTL
ncbi:GH3 auxin-responsive promoter family protein [Sphingobacterium oryzagri]|uniref:GH3 auxin-responsive promoter family protein n=1 Tax=Sphingobacterium oryzagri TaxID=3025669 RepID=A0ABY7WFG1_9SPHI|nr:GH3 auxin-responsive promoter family protein [Sphingobacterium sp. KACC 22765]WDF67212.1 GH3 auxin-responsive promoter family protein [Sphingobacterium sp. KACC 22765]